MGSDSDETNSKSILHSNTVCLIMMFVLYSWTVWLRYLTVGRLHSSLLNAVVIRMQLNFAQVHFQRSTTHDVMVTSWWHHRSSVIGDSNEKDIVGTEIYGSTVESSWTDMNRFICYSVFVRSSKGVEEDKKEFLSRLQLLVLTSCSIQGTRLRSVLYTSIAVTWNSLVAFNQSESGRSIRWSSRSSPSSRTVVVTFTIENRRRRCWRIQLLHGLRWRRLLTVTVLF